ncbi:MAG: ATP-binding protein [Tannerellaceae bacterium]|jgi:hypothetical protein|nr:ATP-binding protein [Tannerellaceae bacterium]
MKKKHPIESLIEQAEHQQLDFKFEITDSKKIARTLSAFANTDGGRLLIGVKDNGVISGICDEEEYYMIEAASGMYTRPEIPFTATRWEIYGKTVLEIYVPPSPRKPHTAPGRDNIYKAYIRVHDENMPANDVLLLSWKKILKKDGILLKCTKPVEALLGYLDTHDHISSARFCRIAHINYYTAKNILSDLLAIDTLQYTVVNKRIVYKRKLF